MFSAQAILAPFFNEPAVQSLLAPLLVGLLLAYLFRDFGGWSGLAVTGGLLVTAALTMGLGLEPLTATRKLLLLAVLGAVLGIVLELYDINEKTRQRGLGLLGAGSMLWVSWPALPHLATPAEIVVVILSLAYAALVGALFGTMAQWRARDAALVTILLAALSSGLLFAGASALLGQLAMAIAAAAAAVAWGLRHRSQASGSVLGVGAGLTLGLLGGSGLVYASVSPWWLLGLAGLSLVSVLLGKKLASKVY